MAAIRRKSVLGLAVLLAAATVAADTVTAPQEALSPSVESADAAHATQIPGPQVAPDSGGAATRSPATEDAIRTHAKVIDTLDRGASPNQMVAKCREMYGVLIECGRSNDTIVELLRDAEREEAALRRIWPSGWALCLPGVLGSVPCGLLGIAIGAHALPPDAEGTQCLGGAVGCILGGAAGTALGAALGADARRHTIIAHREYVNTLVRRVNRAVLIAP